MVAKAGPRKRYYLFHRQGGLTTQTREYYYDKARALKEARQYQRDANEDVAYLQSILRKEGKDPSRAVQTWWVESRLESAPGRDASHWK